MKIAVLLRGYLYKEIYKKIYHIDYELNFDGINDQILSNKNIDLYIVSYINNKYSEEYLINKFNPIKIILLKEEYQQLDLIKIGLQMIKNNNIKYNNVLITRFDLYFKLDIYNLNYDYNKINFIWKEINDNNQVGDCLHFINYNLIDLFIDAIDKCEYKACGHHLNKYLDNNYIHIIFNNPQWSNSDHIDNILYVIKRTLLKNFFKNRKFKKN